MCEQKSVRTRECEEKSVSEECGRSRVCEQKSDVDILVDLDYSVKIGLGFIKMKTDLEKILNKKVDLVSSNGLSIHLKPIIDKEKKLIYARQIG